MQFVNLLEFEFMKPKALSAIKLLQAQRCIQVPEHCSLEKAMAKKDNQSKEAR